MLHALPLLAAALLPIGAQSKLTPVSGFNSSERCDCSSWACGWDSQAPHGRANITYELQLTWVKYPNP